MGRHRIYNTDEEKRDANRAKSKRHHNKYVSLLYYLRPISFFTYVAEQRRLSMNAAGKIPPKTTNPKKVSHT